ncbi:MAG: putative quinol monooxygenase [Candidatus Binatia bacterium]
MAGFLERTARSRQPRAGIGSVRSCGRATCGGTTHADRCRSGTRQARTPRRGGGRGGEDGQASQAEAGCRAYAFYSDLEDPNLFIIFEEWESEAALQAHFKTPHMAEFNALIPQLVAGPLSINRYEVAAVVKMM